MRKSRWRDPSQQHRTAALQQLEDALVHARSASQVSVQLLLQVVQAAAAILQQSSNAQRGDTKSYQGLLSEALAFVLDYLQIVAVNEEFVRALCALVGEAHRVVGTLGPALDVALFDALLRLFQQRIEACDMVLLSTIVCVLHAPSSELAERLPAAAALFSSIAHQQPDQRSLLIVVKGLAVCLAAEWEEEAEEEQCVACFDALFGILEQTVHAPTFMHGSSTQDQLLVELLTAIDSTLSPDKTKSKRRTAIRARAKQQLRQLNQLVFSICRQQKLRAQAKPAREQPETAPRRSLKPGGGRETPAGAPPSATQPVAAEASSNKSSSVADADKLQLAVLGVLGSLAELHPTWFTSQWGLYVAESADLAGYLVDIIGAAHRAACSAETTIAHPYLALSFVHQLWRESGFAAWEMSNSAVLSQSARAVPLESAILGCLLPSNSVGVRCAALRCLLRIAQATEFANWFTTGPSTSGRTRSKRPAASLAQSITEIIVTTLQALLICLHVERDETVVEMLLACIVGMFTALPLPSVPLLDVALSLSITASPSAAEAEADRVQLEPAQPAHSPPSAFILKRQAKKMWSLASEGLPIQTCERIIETVVHLQIDWAFGLRTYGGTRQRFQVPALKMLNELMVQLCRGEKVCTKIPRCMLVPLLLRFPNGNLLTTLFSLMGSGGPHTLQGRCRAFAVSASTACAPAFLVCWDPVSSGLVKLVGSRDDDLRHTSLDIMEAFLRTRLFVMDAAAEADIEGEERKHDVGGTVYELMIGPQMPDLLLADMTLAFSDAAHAVRSSAAYCIAHFTAADWIRYGSRAEKLLHCLLGATTDKVGAVRAASFNALGHAMSRVLLDPAAPMRKAAMPIVDTVLAGVGDSKLAVRIQAVWALGTLAQSIIPGLRDEGAADEWLEKWQQMCAAGLSSLNDSDKLISSALRTLGYLGRGLAILAPSSPLLAHALEQLIQKMQSSTSLYFEEKFKSNVCRAIGVIVKEPNLQATLRNSVELPDWVANAVRHLSHLLTSDYVKVQMYAAAALYHISSAISNVDVMLMIVESLFQSIARQQEAAAVQQDRPATLPPRQITECNFQWSRLLRRVLEIADPDQPAGSSDSSRLAEEVLFRIGYYSKDLLAWLQRVAEATPLLPDAITHRKTFEAAKNARLTAQLLLHIFSSRQGELNVLQHAVQAGLQALCMPADESDEQTSGSSRLVVEVDDEL